MDSPTIWPNENHSEIMSYEQEIPLSVEHESTMHKTLDLSTQYWQNRGKKEKKNENKKMTITLFILNQIIILSW